MLNTQFLKGEYDAVVVGAGHAGCEAALALARTGYGKEDAVLIGDRLYTDIACGVNAGIDTIFVLSGEGTLKDLEESPEKPTYTLQNIREVLNNIK